LPATSKSNDIPDYYSRDHFGSRHSLAKIWYGPLKNDVCASRAHYRHVHVWPIQLYIVRQ
jgi:hypothetical protein